MKNILVPTDFSDNSMQALRFAMDLAKAHDSAITLLSAYHIPAPAAEFGTVIDAGDFERLRVETNHALEGLAEEVRADFSGEVSVLALAGFASSAITRYMEEEQPWLTVMGSKGATGIERFVWGSVASEVAAQATRPLLVVPEGHKYQGFREVLFSTDFRDEDVEVTRFIQVLQPDLEALHIHYLHVVNGQIPEPFEQEHLVAFQQQLRGLANVPDMSFEMSEEPRIEKAIVAETEEETYDLLVVSPHRRNWFMRLFIPSVSRAVVNQSGIPTLLYPFAS
jgi:nucleotide-binding universal stress UspA family protein